MVDEGHCDAGVAGSLGYGREVLVRAAGAERVGGDQEQHPGSMANRRPTPLPFDRLCAGTVFPGGRGQLDRTTRGPRSVRDVGEADFFMRVPQPVPQRPYAAVCEYPSSRAHAITFQPHGLTAVAAARQAWG
jgi:hypothetical protein